MLIYCDSGTSNVGKHADKVVSGGMAPNSLPSSASCSLRRRPALQHKRYEQLTYLPELGRLNAFLSKDCLLASLGLSLSMVEGALYAMPDLKVFVRCVVFS